MLVHTARTLTKSLSHLHLLHLLPLSFLAQQKPPVPQKPTPKADIISKLSTQLQDEIKYEKENPPQAETAVQSIKDKGWTLTNDGLLYELRRQVGDKTVVVSFTARSPPVQPPEEEKQQDNKKPEGEQQQDEEQDAPQDISEFNVYVSKPGSTEVLVAQYLVNGLQMNLMSMSFTKDYQSHRRSNRYDRPLGLYQGPELDSLDETLVERLHEYFESLGIDEELVSFVSDYSVHAEHPHYVKWLEEVRTFIK